MHLLSLTTRPASQYFTLHQFFFSSRRPSSLSRSICNVLFPTINPSPVRFFYPYLCLPASFLSASHSPLPLSLKRRASSIAIWLTSSCSQRGERANERASEWPHKHREGVPSRAYHILSAAVAGASLQSLGSSLLLEGLELRSVVTLVDAPSSTKGVRREEGEEGREREKSRVEKAVRNRRGGGGAQKAVT